MKLSLLSFLLVVPCALSALVTDYIVTTNVAGVLSTITSIYDPASRTTTTSKHTTTTSTTTTTTPTTITSTSSSTTGTTGTATSTDTSMVTTVITSTLANNAITTYTTVVPLASDTTSGYVNSRNRPDPSTSVTPQPATPVTTLSWQSWVTITEGDTTYTSSLGPITVWITLTTNGVVTTIPTTFIQRFSTQYSTIAQPSSGSIGLGTISGRIGVVKTDYQTTVKYNNAFNLQASHPILSICAVLLSWLL